MDAEKELGQEFGERTRPHRLSPQMKITEVGIVLGPGTVLAPARTDGRGRPLIALDEARAAALLATTFERGPAPLMAPLRRAVDLFNAGEPALAQFHLIFAGAPPCDTPEATLRLFVAEEMLSCGVDANDLLKLQGFAPVEFSGTTAHGVRKANFNPLQPRDGRGWWTSGGGAQSFSGAGADAEAVAEPAAFRGGRRGRAISRLLEWLRSLRGKGANEGEVPPRPAELPATRQEERAPPAELPHYPLPRPGRGEPVDIPELPGVRGEDITKPSARMANYESELTREEFETALRERGWRIKQPPSDEVTEYLSPNGARYAVRDVARKHDGPTAEYFRPGRPRGSGLADMKLRLRKKP